MLLCIFAYWSDLNEICQKYLSYDWALLERFLRSKVKGHDQTECCSDKNMHFDGVSLSLRGFKVSSHFTA